MKAENRPGSDGPEDADTAGAQEIINTCMR